MAKRLDSGEGRPGRKGRVRQNRRNTSPRFAHIQPDTGDAFQPKDLLNEVVRAQAWGIRELARVALDEADDAYKCPECGCEVPVPGDAKGRVAAVTALLDYGLKLMKQSDAEGMEELGKALVAGLGRLGDGAERPESMRDLQRKAAGKLGAVQG